MHVDEQKPTGYSPDHADSHPFHGIQFKPFWDLVTAATVLSSLAGSRGWPHGSGGPMEEHDNMDYFYQQVLQKDVTRRLQVGQDLIDYINDPQRSPDVEQDKPRLDKTIDELTGWVNSSNFKVRSLLYTVY